MNLDISGIIKGWGYEPSGVTARWIVGKDGKPKVQLRLDLGLFQMEVEGRPDGTNPRGFPSLLEYYLQVAKVAEDQKKPFSLDAESCAELQQEAMQYYYRYLSFHSLRYYEGVVRDTEHNLTLFDFVSEHTDDDDLVWQFLQFYPYVRMMNARARAEKAMGSKHYEEAVTALQKALDDIQSFWKEYGEDETDAANQEVELLTDLLHQVQKKKPKTAEDKLRDELNQAIAVENYEQAAVIRDRLSKLDVPAKDA